ncbi:MAG TPA: LOG family protein [Opitutaceae bacterium]|nr:LOG family protein [Opitutaceae bacterium]
MTDDTFWSSQDGLIHTLKKKNGELLALVLAFKPRNPAELEFMREHVGELNFTERSSLARIGIEMATTRRAWFEGGKVFLEVDAFIYDSSFPSAPYFQKMLRPGTAAGRLFYAPESAKLSSGDIWSAIKDHRIKLPRGVSIDRFGRVFITPHCVRYTLNPAVTRLQFERVVSGEQTRNFLDKVQIRTEMETLTIAPHSGILTSCSMYLKEHFVVLNRGEGNFGLHCSAVLLDPIKTYGTNIMLEIYNTSDQVVVNPVVSVEVFRAPASDDTEHRRLQGRRKQMFEVSTKVFNHLDATRPEEFGAPRPRSRVSVAWQDSTVENHAVFFAAGNDFSRSIKENDLPPVHRSVVEALDSAPDGADTLVLDYFPNLPEHVELLTRIPQMRLKRVIFRKPSRTHGFFFSTNAHARLDNLFSLGIDVYFHHEETKDLYFHTYKRDCGFFVREEVVQKFMEATTVAFYGSALEIEGEAGKNIETLITSLAEFFGPTMGIMTGGGGGVMGVATERARASGSLTGACFLELEAQPPKLGVDYFNTFQETARHFRQKWFEVCDFCVFNVGGVGTLEEIGIELCNLKLGIRPRIPFVFYSKTYWKDLENQIAAMVKEGRAPKWIGDYILFSDDPREVVEFFRKTLQVL